MRFSLRPGVRRLFRLPLHGADDIHADIDEELETLLDSRIEALMARGVPPDAARAEALRRLGASLDDARKTLHQSAEHRERRMHFSEYVQDLLQDVRYAARGLARRPAFTAVAVLTLAIGIGATTAIFSAVNVLLLRPLPFARPNELMSVSLMVPDAGLIKGSNEMVWSYPKYLVFRDAQTAFDQFALYEDQQFTLAGDGVELIRGESVGATYLRTLGVALFRGRDFDPSLDAHAGALRQVIISYVLWQRRFDGDAAIVGRTIELERAPYTIIGIADPGFAGLTGQAEIFVPITVRPAADLAEPHSHEFGLVARRKSTVSVAQADAALHVLGARIDAQIPDAMSATKHWGANARPLDGGRVAPMVRRSLLILFGAVCFVMLIACVNVANLLLGRASARRREIAVRLAIGAGRGRLIRLLLAESLLLAAVGGACSIGVAWLGTRALSGVNPEVALRSQRLRGLGAVSFRSIELDWRTLAFALGLSLIVGLLFGLVPALVGTRASLSDAMKSGVGGVDGERGVRLSGRRALVILEVALAMVLLVGSGLMIRSLSNLLRTNVGFNKDNVFTLRMTALPSGAPRDSLPPFYDQLSVRLAAIPGVVGVGLSNCAPLSGGCNKTIATSKDGVAFDQARSPLVGIHWTNTDWFKVLGVPLLRGRVFDNSDVLNSPKVLVINETAARTFFPGQNPIGRRLGVGQGGMQDGAEIVGLVGDVRQSPDSAPDPEVYVTVHQVPRARLRVFLKTSVDPTSITADVRRALHDVAPRYPVDEVGTMAARVRAATAPARFSAILLGLFAATALSLAVIGIYGVMSLVVTARTREIGIRIALGADQERVQRLVVGEGVALVAMGAAIGVAGALACTRVLRSLLFDLTPTDPYTYSIIILLLAVTAIAASWIPARRAARVDPVEALRAD